MTRKLTKKVFLDANVFDWFLEDSDDVHFVLREADKGHIQLMTSLEVAFELRKTTDLDKRDRLEEVLRRVMPLRPTRYGRAGVARLGLTEVVPGAGELFDRLRALNLKNWDPTHLLNCYYDRCDAFVTCDKGLSGAKRPRIEQIIGAKILDPRGLVDWLRN